ncbi:MAG: hypothetical protein V3S73_03925 [Gammaproteobacteria bacterium]
MNRSKEWVKASSFAVIVDMKPSDSFDYAGPAIHSGSQFVDGYPKLRIRAAWVISFVRDKGKLWIDPQPAKRPIDGMLSIP